MINLSREALTNILIANRDSFSEFPIVESFCVTHESANSAIGGHYAILVKEINSVPKLKRAIEECVRAPFEIDTSNYEIFSGIELCTLIRNNPIIISEGEETWISNIERVHDSLKKGACCSTKAALTREADACYTDLVSQCDSSWIFIKNIKDFVNAESLSFHLQGATSKTV
jgi:hypothetical protein|tara:strand:- start:3965 stop:4480 length:516 start_codon:yes stop_codon:yes gene_type:complete